MLMNMASGFRRIPCWSEKQQPDFVQGKLEGIVKNSWIGKCTDKSSVKWKAQPLQRQTMESASGGVLWRSKTPEIRAIPRTQGLRYPKHCCQKPFAKSCQRIQLFRFNGLDDYERWLKVLSSTKLWMLQANRAVWSALVDIFPHVGNRGPSCSL